MTPAAASGAVTVRAPGRLHLGFLDPSASLGRRFGSIGLVIDGYGCEVRLRAAPRDEVLAPDGAVAERVAGLLHALRRHSGRTEALRVEVVRALPAHAGFGSGTQLALAVGRAFASWHRLDLATPLLGHWLGRGLRSGIGIHGFDRGGLIVDGGPGADGLAAPLLARVEPPDAWRIVVVEDPSDAGLSGAAETQAIDELPPLSQAGAADICHQVLMRILPGAAGADFAPFAAGVSRVQQLLGAHFAPAQQGRAYTSEAVEALMAWIGRAVVPAPALGQSSWGPTAFAIVESPAAAERLIAAAHAAGQVAPRLTLRTVAARRCGAVVVDDRGAVGVDYRGPAVEDDRGAAVVDHRGPSPPG